MVRTTIEDQREWLALLEAELARRVAQAEWDAGQKERDWERLWGELAAMGQRMPAVTPPDRTGLPEGAALIELAEQFVRARDRARVDELRIPADLAPTEATALAVSPEAGMRLLDEYVRTRLGQG